MKTKSQILTGCLLILAVLTVNSCNNSRGQSQRPAPQVQSFPVLELQLRSTTLVSGYPATFEGVQTVEIRPRVQGYIVEMLVEEGAIVEKGQTMFRLNNEEYQQQIRMANANIKAAEASVQSAKNQVKRLAPLAEQEIISIFELESAKYDLQSQKAQLAQAEASLVNARVNLGYTYIKSPVDGVIGTIPYRIGSLVNSAITRPLTIVSDISKVYAYFSMSERELLEMARVAAGNGGPKTLQQRVRDMPDVKLRLADNTLYKYDGTLNLASGLIETQTGSASFRALFPNPQRILRSGGTGTVLIPVPVDSAIIIPKKATYELQDKRFVYIVTDSNTVESTEIQALANSTDKLFVVKEGLSPDSKIIIAGMGRLSDGMPIRPQPVNADSLYQALQ